jgi:hypothetical protein
MASWPGTLPDFVTVDGFQETMPSNVIRTGMDVGPPKLRRRATSAPRLINCTQIMTGSQITDLETFYITTLVGGTQQFTWKNPRTAGAVTTMRFVDPPSYSSAGGGSYYQVNYKLEIL